MITPFMYIPKGRSSDLEHLCRRYFSSELKHILMKTFGLK